MEWNDYLKALLGIVVGAVLASTAIAYSQTHGTTVDLDILNKIAAIIVAPLTLGLVALSWVLARETRQTWVQNRTPHILVTIEQARHFGFFDLVVENVGTGTAFDIHAALNPDVLVTADHRGPQSLSQMSIMNFAVLKPRQRISTFCGRLNHFDPQRTVASCECHDADGKLHQFTNVIDLTSYADVIQLGEDAQMTVAEEVKEIRKTLEKLADGWRRLEVNTYDSADRAEERKAEEERYASHENRRT